MSARHTPGPWAIDGCVSLGNMDVVYGSGRITMMDCENDEVDDDALLANARLIAAAPDLLAALNDMVDLFRTMHPDLVGNPFFIHARAVIAKAEAVA